MKEHNLVVLKKDQAMHGLEAGDVGTIVHVYPGAEGFEVEFVSGDGETVAVVTLEAATIRPFEASEILHARKLAS